MCHFLAQTHGHDQGSRSQKEKCCADLMFMAKEARKHKLGPLHPSYNLLQLVKDSLQAGLPQDAHLRASGKLCISLTRVRDGKNVLVSDFDSRDELIQALLCSCFVPFYCGVIPPTFRGVHYVDGAASDNLPRCHYRNTITVSAYAGESDICPRGSTLNFHEVRFNNVSIQVTSENVYRVTSTFFPPEPEVMAEICHNGCMDALRFLQDNNLINCESPERSLEPLTPPSSPVEGLETREDQDWWQNPDFIENLPLNLRKVLCAACRERHPAGGLLSHVSDKVTSILWLPSTKSLEPAFSLAQRLLHWLPDVRKDVSWFSSLAGGFYKRAWLTDDEDESAPPLMRRCSSLPAGLNLFHIPDDGKTTPTCGLSTSDTDHMPLTPPPTPTSGSEMTL
uniref:patatin-like phospholipase domain-containing protein 2 isoform X2 n=1 Tax=Doryrhamphus excisus TaxID=161450 RepID=UPI0025AEB376|nr:patatin-like phospholipase domain-containing protein 2 isoform X2 [Doryrhamphus excisus]